MGPGVPGEVTGHGKTGSGLTAEACHTPGLNLACNIPARQRYQLYFAEGKQAQRGEVICPGSHSKAESGGFPGLSDSRAQTPSIEPQYFVIWGEREQRCLGGSEQRGYIGNMKNGTNERHKVTQRLNKETYIVEPGLPLRCSPSALCVTSIKASITLC